MIRRGLQIVMAWALLGAAPLHAFTSSNSLVYPDRIIVQNVPVGPANGVYASLGPDLVNVGTYWYARYGQSNNVAYTARLTENPAGIVSVWLFNGNNQIGASQNTNRETWAAAGYPPLGPSTAWFSTGQFIFEFGDPNPYEQAFPDWESASMKIPLGFTFGLTFWAACLAFHAPMRWVRQLSDAAS